MKPLALASLVLFTLGCGGAASPPAASPRTPDAPRSEAVPGKTQPAVSSDPFALGSLREESFADVVYEPITAPLAAPPQGLAAAPASCAARAARKPSAKPACEDALTALDAALAEDGEGARDAKLADLEACTTLPAGTMRALRIELGDAACGDALSAPLVGKPGPSPEVQHVLAGLALAARLARTVQKPPAMKPPYDKERVVAFVKGALKTWIVEQAKLVEELSAQASRLKGYGRAVAAMEAGLADLRFVDVVRAVPVPDAIAKDTELKGVYEAALDQMLEPRKDRGRDAVLVGLKELAQVGVVRDARVAKARDTLGRLYAGRRIDALDALQLPPAIEPASTLDATHRLARRLPTFYSGVLLDAKALVDRNGAAAFATTGLPLSTRRLVKSSPPAAGEVSLSFARARLELARTYWRAVDFDEAAALAKASLADKATARDAELLLAVAIALRGGPEDASQLMRKPDAAEAAANLGALDAVTRAGGPHAAIAAYDAAWIKRVTAPRGPNAAYWQDVSARFKNAAALFVDATQKKRAEEAAREADSVARESK